LRPLFGLAVSPNGERMRAPVSRNPA
jgi:hypothetical protein